VCSGREWNCQTNSSLGTAWIAPSIDRATKQRNLELKSLATWVFEAGEVFTELLDWLRTVQGHVYTAVSEGSGVELGGGDLAFLGESGAIVPLKRSVQATLRAEQAGLGPGHNVKMSSCIRATAPQ